jgi:hypothetical protein
MATKSDAVLLAFPPAFVMSRETVWNISRSAGLLAQLMTAPMSYVDAGADFQDTLNLV